MDIKLNSSDKLRVYGNGTCNTWQDIQFEHTQEVLKLPMYVHSDYKIYKYIEIHENGLYTKGIIKIPREGILLRIEELEKKGFILKEIDFSTLKDEEENNNG